MASRLRPTPETGTVAATKQRAQSIGPSWSTRGGRQARLALRDAIRSGDREGAMRVAAFAQEQGFPAQATIGSAESRMATTYQQTGSDKAKQAEMGAVLDAGQVQEPAPVAGGARRQAEEFASPPRTAANTLRPQGPVELSSTPSWKDPGGRGGLARQLQETGAVDQFEALGKDGEPLFPSGSRGNTSVLDADTQRRVTAMQMAYGVGGGVRAKQPSSPAEPPPVAPGATPPPENPVSGTSVPPVTDVRTRLSQRQPFALQGLAGRQAFDANLKKSIEAGGSDISEERFANMQKEATRLGISREQLLTRLQDMGGVSLPTSATAPTADNRSLDQRLQSYQDKYLGGGSAAELPGKLRASSAEGSRRAAAMSDIQPADVVASEAYGPGNLVRPSATPPARTAAAVLPKPVPTPGIPRGSAARQLGVAGRELVGRALSPAVAAEEALVGAVNTSLQPARAAVAAADVGLTAATVAGRSLRENLKTGSRVLSTGLSVALDRARRNREAWRQAGREFVGGLSNTPR